MKFLVIGGAGFIGCNTVSRLLDDKHYTIVFDNLCRKGSTLNLDWLRTQGKFEFIQGDVRNGDDLKKVFLNHDDIDVVVHLAAQVAVTTSIAKPQDDFETNALGTFNVLEAIRLYANAYPILLHSSTNKVYGKMEDVVIIEENDRYKYRDMPKGISENRALDFHSPYGCSKGCADQYVRDYARIYGLKTVVFRQSCIYGLHQFGVEEQGWVAWFTIANVLEKPITIYGDGKQVRDVLFVEDLVEGFLLAIENIDRTSGEVYNIGGGPNNQLSLLELISFLEKLSGKEMVYSLDNWRPGDQPVFVCDITKACDHFGWSPKIGVKNGISKLYHWVYQNQNLLLDVT